MLSFFDFIAQNATAIAAITAVVSFAAMVFAFANSIQLHRSIVRLMRRLHRLEAEVDANFADATDRELRKIAIYLSHFSDEEKVVDFKNKPFRKKDEDAKHFVTVFESLDGEIRDRILKSVKSDNAVQKMELFRNILKNSHQGDYANHFILYPKVWSKNYQGRGAKSIRTKLSEPTE